jgi:hypothetical protein
MTITIYDRVQETTNTSGTGSLHLLGAVAGFLDFNSTVGVSNQTYYGVIDPIANIWEIGIGTLVDSTTLSRDTIISSTNENNKISLVGNVVSVFIDVPASKRIQIDSQNIGLSDVTSFSGNDVNVTQEINAPNINTNLNTSNTIGQAGNTVYYGDGSNLTGLYRAVDDQSGSSYTLSDGDQMVTFENGSAVTVTIPANTFPVLTEIDLIQMGSGQVTVAAADGVTVNSYVGKMSIAGQYAGATLKQLSTNNWILIGNLA